MSIPDFEVVTDEIVAFLTTDLTQVDQVLPFPPLELAGNSPVLSVHDDGVVPVDGTWKRWWVGYILTQYINRETGAADAEALLRQIRKAVFTSLEANMQGDSYQYIEIRGTNPSFAVVDGVHYRTEEVNFRVRVDCYS